MKLAEASVNMRWAGKSASAAIYAKLHGVISRGIRAIERQAKLHVPVGVSGLLRQSYGSYLDTRQHVGYAGIVSPRGGKLAGYAAYVEGLDPKTGRERPGATKRYFVPFKAAPGLHLWAVRKGYFAKRLGLKRTSLKRAQAAFTPDKGGLLVWGYKVPALRNALDACYPGILSDLHSVRIGGQDIRLEAPAAFTVAA